MAIPKRVRSLTELLKRPRFELVRIAVRLSQPENCEVNTMKKAAFFKAAG